MIHWFDNRSIKTRVLISALVPLVVVTVTLGYYMTTARLRDVDQQLEQRGTVLVNYLAPLSEFGLFANNRDMLEPVLRHALAEPDVESVVILDTEKKVVLRGDNSEPSKVAATAVPLQAQDKTLVFTAPIRSSQVPVSDYPPVEEQGHDKESGKVLGWVEVRLSTTANQGRQAQILRNSILMILAGIVLSALLALMIGRSVTGPVGEIIETVRRLRKGRLEARVPIDFGGELATLSEGINTMAETLGQAQDRLAAEVSQATSNLRSTVKSLEKRNRELDEARKAAMQAGEAKSEFLAKMSHEIRTPLNAVIGFSGLLEKTPQTEQQREYTATVSQAASSLLSVIDDILNISRLESGALTLKPAYFDLRDSLETVVTMLSAAAHEKGLELVLLMHSDVPERIYADGSRIKQIVINLLNNAIKFTENGHVVVEVSVAGVDGQQITTRIDVTDTGIGLSGEAEAYVFEPFLQASSTTSRQYGGTGLGLSISKQLVNLLGGEIGVKSTPGQGSTFWFTLPARIYEEHDRGRRLQLHGIKVLVYDQNDYARRSLRNRFISWGANVFNTGEWNRVLDLLRSAEVGNEPYRLLILGLSAQERDDAVIIDLLNATAHWAEIPVLLLVGDDHYELPIPIPDERNIRAILKPAPSRALLRNVTGLLEKQNVPEVVLDVSAPASIIVGNEFEGMRVLVAEDNRFNRELIIKLLNGLGVSVQMAVDGREAEQCAAKQVFDLILMDIHMPVMGGVSAAQTIRRGLNQQTPIVALTADVFADRDQRLGAIGIDDCMYKPVSDDKLIDVLYKWGDKRSSVARLSGLAKKKPSGANGDGSEGRDGRIPGELLHLLHDELNVQLQGLRNAFRDQDVDRMRNHAHQLKGLTGYFGLMDFHKKTGVLQQAIIAGKQAEIDDLLARLETTAGQFIDSPTRVEK